MTRLAVSQALSQTNQGQDGTPPSHENRGRTARPRFLPGCRGRSASICAYAGPMGSDPLTAPDARRLLAALANGEARRVFAEISIGGTPGGSLTPGKLSPAKLARALGLLTEAGLVETVETEGSVRYRLREHAFRDALASLSPAPSPSGVERFLTADGRIDRYPARRSDRLKLLAWVATRVLDTSERAAERELNERLAGLTDDVPMLRRYLVDYGIVNRTPDGSAYWLALEEDVDGGEDGR